jgi:cell division septation protein DedD
MRERIGGLLQDGLPVPDALAVVLRDLRIDPEQQLVNVIRTALNSQNANRKRPSPESVAMDIKNIVDTTVQEAQARGPPSAADLAEMLLNISIAEPPIANPPTAEPPTADEPTAEPPTVEPPTADEPTANEPTAEPPTADLQQLPMDVDLEAGRAGTP